MRRVSLLGFFVLALAGCDSDLLRPVPPPLGEALTGDQIAAVLTGNSLVTAKDVVPPLVVFFGPDSDLHGLRSNVYKDRGTWTVVTDEVCGAWNNWYGTLSHCWKVYRAGDRFTLKRPDSHDSLVATLEAGDVARLK